MNSNRFSAFLLAGLCVALTACGGGAGDSRTAVIETGAGASTVTDPVAGLASAANAPFVINVRTAAELTQALTVVVPGQTIALAVGEYAGHFVAKRTGRQTLPITIKGPSGAVLNGKNVATGYGFHLDSVSYYILEGFTITGSQKGLMLDGASHNVVQHVTVFGVGMEAIHLRKSSSDNTVKDNIIHSTGLFNPVFGEGVYVGSSSNNWNLLMGGVDKPDTSNNNLIHRNRLGPNISAEAIDLKEGSSGSRIELNRIDSSGMTSADAAIDVKSNDSLIIGNSLVNTPSLAANVLVDGFQSHALTVAGVTYGQRNTFSLNLINLNTTEGTAGFIVLPSGAGAGFGINLVGSVTGTVCSNNQLLGSGAGLTNIATTVCP